MQSPLPPKFARIVALMDGSTFEHERINARRSAERLAEDYGWTFEEALRVTIRSKPRDPPTRAEAEAATRAMHAKAERESARLRERRSKLDPLITLYGSFEAALAPCWREQALFRAVAQWRVTSPAPDDRWTRTLDNNTDPINLAPKVIHALRQAYILPCTFAEAKSECDYWMRRTAEMKLLRRVDGDPYSYEALDLVPLARYCIVLKLALQGLLVENLQELQQRYDMVMEEDDFDLEHYEAIRKDIKRLAARELERSKFSSKRDVALEIRLALEKNKDQFDRVISRAIGCSPTTVGRVRRQMEKERNAQVG